MVNWQQRRVKFGLMVSILILIIQNAYGTNYYINKVSGSDQDDGTSTESAWSSLANINTTIFYPGDSILLRAGQLWVGTLQPQGSGAEGKPIVIGRYGDGANPMINGAGLTNCTTESGESHYCAIFLYNQEYWTIQDLEIVNYNEAEENMTLQDWENTNKSNYSDVTNPPQYDGINTRKSAILIEANNKGAVDGLQFLNLEIHGVNGEIQSKDNGGIFLEVFKLSSSDTPTYFRDLLVEGCHIHDVDRTGISNWSDYDDREFNQNSNWTPNVNYVIRNTTFERTGANALIVRVSDGALIESCVFDGCSIKESGNAAFNFNTDNTIWQYNEFTRTKANHDDEDAGGVDSDYRSKNTTIQYNYLHDNDFGLLVTGGPGRFNDNTILRYNIIERDGLIARKGSDAKFTLRFSGSATNTFFHNNIVYLAPEQSNTKVSFHKSWSGSSPKKTFYYNNIFYVETPGCSYSMGSSQENTFSNNIYFGQTVANSPSDANGITSNPMLSDPGSGFQGYKIEEASPAVGAGARIETIPEYDLYDHLIDHQAPIDIGVHQLSQAVALSSFGLAEESIKVFPNPMVADYLTVQLQGGIHQLTIFEIRGEVILSIKDLTDDQNKINLTHVHRGVYMMKIVGSDGQVHPFKLLKL